MSISTDKQVIELKKDASSYLKLGDFFKAQKSIKKALELKPNSKNLVHELAKINLKSKNFDLSLELLLGLEDRVTKKNILYKDIGLSYFGLGKLEKALYFSDKSLEEDSKYIEALVLKGKTLRELENYDEAMEAYLEGNEPSNEQIKALVRKGTCSFDFVPVLCGSAFKNKGVQPLLDAVVSYLPAPTDIG